MGTNATDRTLLGRYVLRTALGRGGMGVVWRAEDLVLRRQVAVKEVHLPEPLAADERTATKARVLREARAAARLSHPGAVTIYDVVEDNGVPFIVMELVEAPTLLDLVQANGPIAVERAAEIGLELMGVLEVAHSHGIVHRDVKPANVMVPGGGRAKLADFGIATSKDDTRVTSTGLVFGSPAFMSPEQAHGAVSSPASDLWGLGATLYFAVEGAPPFERGGGPIPTLTAIVHDEPRPLERAGPLTPVILALLAKSPEDRPTGESLRRPLRDILWGAGGSRGDGAATASAAGDSSQSPSPDDGGAHRRAAIWHEADAPPSDGNGEQPAARPAAAVSPPGPENRRTDRDGRATGRRAAATAPTGPPAARSKPAERFVAGGPRVVPLPDRARAGEAADPGPARRRWWPALLVLALVAVAAVALFTLIGDDPGAPAASGNSADSSSGAGGASRDDGGASSGPRDSDSSSGSDASSDPGPSSDSASTSTSDSPSVPRRWSEYVIGNTGFTISYPPSWDVVPEDDTRIDFRDPDSSTYLRLDWTDTPGDDAAAAWEDLSASFGASHDNYTEIRIDPTTFKGFEAAEWEFTYSEGGADLHAVDLGFVTGVYGFALNFQTAEEDWTASQDDFARFKAAFTQTG